MRGVDDWTDEEFIDYCESHCRTDRALFYRDHVKRMCKLANAKDLLAVSDGWPEWVSAPGETMLPLVKDARDRLRRKGMLRLVRSEP